MDIKKVTQKDRYGNQVSFEFEAPVKPLDQTAIVKDMMNQGVDQMSMEVPMMMDHPGEPKGTDTVPAWLTPGEFVVNKEAMDVPGNAEIVEEINDQGRAIQANKGMEVPAYYKHGGALAMHRMEGGIPMDGATHMDMGGKISKLHDEGYTAPGQAYAIAKSMGYQQGGDVNPYQLPFLLDLYSKLSGVGQLREDAGRTPTIVKKTPEEIAKSEQPWWETNPDLFKNDGGWITDDLLDKLREVESGGRNDLVSKAGAVGEYQWLPSSAKQAGYGVKAFDPLDPKASRAATKQYLMNMQKYHGFTPEETLRAYNWGPGNVLKHKAGKRKDIPAEALNYPGKILGFDKVEGVPAPKDMPIPTARPDGLGAPPTPKTKEDYGVMDFIKEFFKGGGREYNMGGPVYMQDGGWFDAFRKWNQENEARNVDKRVKQDLALNPSIVGDDPVADYEGEFGVPEAPNLVGDDPVGEYPVPGGTVVPALTDVPKGHQMFGGNENFGGVVNQGPQPHDPSFYEKYIQGRKSKDEQGLPLSENEQRLLNEDYKNYHAANPSLVGDDPVGELSTGDIEGGATTDNKITGVTGESLVGQVDDLSMEHAKSSIKDKVLDKIDKNSVNATGPGEDQPGENKTKKEVIEAGESDPNTVEKAVGFLKDTFGDLFDTKELGRMAVMYAGSRLLGYGHQGSLRFAAKNYLTRVDAKAAGRDKFIQSNAKNYTPASLKKYKETGDLSVLAPIGSPVNVTGEFKNFYKGGKSHRAQKYKVGDNTYWSADGGKTPIDSSYHENASTVQGTPEYNKRIDSESKSNIAVIKDLQNRFDKLPTKEGQATKYRTEISPALQGKKIAEWAAKNDVDAARIGSLMEQAYHDAINDAGNTGRKPRNLVPYLNSLIIREQVPGGTDLLKVKDNEAGEPVFVSGAKMRVTNRNILTRAGLDTDLKNKRNIDKLNNFWTFAQSKWVKLDPKDREQWNRKAGKDTTGFYEYVKTQLES